MIATSDFTQAIDETKSYRKELKMKPTVAATIKAASDAVGMDMSTFMASAAYRAALEIHRIQHVTVLSESAFDAFSAAVDRPGKRNAALGSLFELRAARVQGD